MSSIRYANNSHYAMTSTTHSFNTRPVSTRGTSNTEFRGSTNPDEDWTKISDLAERRRIQNRIAQRNYRKKLKRRLEDLERRANSRSLSPNGDDTDGRSTRESSTENPRLSVSPPSSSQQLVDAGMVPSVSSAYGYAQAYSTSPSYYPHITTSGPDSYSSNYLYSYSQPTLSSMVEATCGGPSLTPDSGYLSIPGAGPRSTYSPEMGSSPKTPPNLYEDTTMSPLYLPYALLSDTPADTGFFNSEFYHHDSPSPPQYHIKSEPKY